MPQPKNKTTIAAEDHLERIHQLITLKGYARPIDIANALNTTQSSVTNMIQKLAANGLLNYQKYRGLTLTNQGKRIALAIHQRHKTLNRLLTLLNIPKQTQEHDIEGIEHHISNQTIRALTKLTNTLENHQKTKPKPKPTNKTKQNH